MKNLENHFAESETKSKIEALVMTGFSPKEIAQKLETSVANIYRICHFNKLSLIELRHSREREIIKSAISDGAETYEDLQKATNLSAHAIRSYCQLAGTKLKRKKSAKKENRDRLVSEGLPINQIAEEEKVTPSAIYSYIKYNRMKKIWKTGHKQYMGEALLNTDFERKIIIGNIVSSVLRNAYQNEKDWAAREAVKYSYGCKKGSCPLPFEKVLSVLRDYDESRNSGKRISFKKIAEKAGIGTMSARRIILYAGGKSLYRTNSFMPHRKKSDF